MTETLSSLITTIHKLKQANQFKQYIDFIQFPYYRNIELNLKVKFEFPFTVFIGPNGCGKSSTLHALYGTVRGKTPGQFWFDTKVDPIQYYNDERKRHSFWYSYKDANGENKEVVKARIRRADNPNYWETSRPLSWAGMTVQERNEPIEKNVLYLDFRAELSAFDKFFYFGDLKHSRSKNKQEFIVRKSLSLKKIFDKEKAYIKSSSQKNLNKRLEILNTTELRYISYILGREYSSCKYLEHSLFRTEGLSVLFKTGYANYSEAVAGSGEIAVVRLVKEILAAPAFSLILLDEPEVSLHPGAQSRLKHFLLEQIKIKKHQIILTSHSPILIKDLPKQAIKVFTQNPSNGRFLIEENLIPEEAFFHIEFPVDNKKNIIVEDKLALNIINTVLSKLGNATKSLFNVRYFPGGASVIKQNFITVFCREEKSNDYIIFDGDQKKVVEHLDWKDLPVHEVELKKLKELNKVQTGEEIKFPVDGNDNGSNEKQQLELQKKYLEYYKKQVYYLPASIPEEIIWDNTKAKQLIHVVKVNSETGNIFLDIEQIVSIKEKFSKVALVVLGNDSNECIFTIHNIFIQAWIEKQDASFLKVKEIIEKIAEL